MYSSSFVHKLQFPSFMHVKIIQPPLRYSIVRCVIFPRWEISRSDDIHDSLELFHRETMVEERWPRPVNSISIHHSKVLHLDAPPLFRAENNGRRKRCTREIRGGRSENRESRARDSPPLIWSPWFRPRREGGRRRRPEEKTRARAFVDRVTRKGANERVEDRAGESAEGGARWIKRQAKACAREDRRRFKG